MQTLSAAMAGVTALYAALLAILLVALSVNVIRHRLAKRVSLGDGEDESLRRAIRTQGNFVEYVPLALILMLLLELNGAGALLLHGLGIALLAGRLLHALGILAGSLRPRQIGMVLSLGVLLVGALALPVRML